MKDKILFIFLASFSFAASAQTGPKENASKKVSAANAQADINQGKKIQQQTLNKPFEKITDTVAIPTKKKIRKTKRIKHN